MTDVEQDHPVYDCFGMKISLMTSDDLLDLYDAHISRGEQCVTAYQNMHGLYARQKNKALDRLHRHPKTTVYIDGMPIVMLCRLAGLPATRSHRVTFVDVIDRLMDLAERRRWRIFYLGASEDVLRAGLAAIRASHPRLNVIGHSGFFDESTPTGRHVLDEIAAFQPNLILVGMGMGRQEQWISDNLAALEPACVLAVGALIEYVAGAVPVAPRWMGRTGLEWLFRLSSDPKRFWFRYLVEPFAVALMLLRWIAIQKTVEFPLIADSTTMGPVTAMRREDAVRAHDAILAGGSR